MNNPSTEQIYMYIYTLCVHSLRVTAIYQKLVQIFTITGQGLLDDLDATLVSELYISRPSSTYSFYKYIKKNILKLIENISE